MTIRINSEQHNFSSPLSIEEALDQIELASKDGIAIAVNEQVIPKSSWTTYELKENDEVLIVTATQGG